MLSIIAKLICSTSGLVLNKVRSSAAEKLKDGDTTDEKLRDVIIEDLDDIKTKIDALSRKDLRSSYCFLKEGVVTLNLALDEAKDEQITTSKPPNDAPNEGSQTTATNESESGILNDAIALSHAIQNLNNTSSVNGRLVSAKERFKAALEEATRAFCNEALSLPDRIMAAKLRVVSKILESLQDTKAAAAGCMLFLEELHNLPGIGEMFTTYFEGGMRSKFYKDSRLENVKSVLSLNFAILEFAARFTGELPNMKNWPRIHLSTRNKTIHPLFLDNDVVKKILGMEEFQSPTQGISTKLLSTALSRNLYCTNSKGQLLGILPYDKGVKILNKSGQWTIFCQLRQATENCEGSDQMAIALAINRHDNVFVIINFEYYTRNKYLYVLFVFDSSGNEKCERVLVDFRIPLFDCVVDNDDNIIFKDLLDKHLYVCDSNGNNKPFLSLEQGAVTILECVTDQDEIVTRCGTRSSRDKVLVYTKEGTLKRTIKVKGVVLGVKYNNSTSKIEILVDTKSEERPFSILSYNDNYEVERLCLPVKKLVYDPISYFAVLISPSNSRENYQVLFG